MRHIFHSPGKLGLKLGFMLVLAVSMMWFCTDVSLAQTCEVDPLDVRPPISGLDTGLSRDIYPAVGIDQDAVRSQIDIAVGLGLLSCGSNYQAPFYTEPLEYIRIEEKSYVKVTERHRYITVFLSCVPKSGNSIFPVDPDISTHDYTKPWVTFQGAGTTFSIDEEGKLGVPASLESYIQNDFEASTSGSSPTFRDTSTTVSYSYLVPNEVLAITYKEYELETIQDPLIGGVTNLTKFDEMAHNLAMSYLTMKLGALSDDVTYNFLLSAIDGEISTAEAASMIANALLTSTGHQLDVVGTTIDVVDAGQSFSTEFSEWAVLVQQMHSTTPYVYTSAYQESELYINSSEISDGLYERTLPGGFNKKIAVEWNSELQTFLIAGAGFLPGSSIHYKVGVLGQPLITEGYVGATSNTALTAPERSVYLDYGLLYRAIPIDVTWNLPAGCYFVSVYAFGKEYVVKGGNFVYVDGAYPYGPFLPQGYTPSGQSILGAYLQLPNPVQVRTCSNPVEVLTEHANIFSSQNCGGDITWFSGHPANGPGASGQQSLFVPAGAVVNVSSNDDGGGDRNCFAATVNNLALVGWQDRIQWAQVVPGGSCQPIAPPSPDYITLDTSGGDVVLHTGESWTNQHNWQVFKIWQDGSSNVTLTHQNGSQRCWDYDVMNLQNDGDWFVQTSSASVSSGTCPGNDAVLCRNDNGTECKAFEVGEYNLLETGLNDAFRSLTSVGSGRSVMIYRENGSFGTAECYNGPRVPLPAGGEWDLRGQGTVIQVFSQPNCPASEIKALVMYRDFDQGGPALGLGKQPGVINLTQVPGPIYGNDWGASLRIPAGMSAKAYIDVNKGGNNSGCKTGNVNLAGEFYRQVSSIWLFDNSSCDESQFISQRIAPLGKLDGLQYQYHEGVWTQLPDFTALTPKKSGVVANFTHGIRDRTDYYAVRYTGCLDIPTAGSYTFWTRTDDGSRIFIDEQLIVNNDGTHGIVEKQGSVSLTKGKHYFIFDYFEYSAGEYLVVEYAGPGISRRSMPNSAFTCLSEAEILAQKIAALGNLSGLQYQYHEGVWTQLPDFTALTPKKSGVVANFTHGIRDRTDYYAVRYTGCLDIPTAGSYTFWTRTDDGSRIFIDEQLIVNNDGTHGIVEKQGSVSLTKGKHYFIFDYFEYSAGEYLVVEYAGPGISRRSMPSTAFTCSGVTGSSAQETDMTNTLYLPLINR